MIERYSTLKLQRRGAALWVTIDNPPVNGATLEMKAELNRIFRDISNDPETRCVVFTGAGSTFSAGGDIKRMERMIDDRALWMSAMPEARQLVVDMLDCDKPIIGRINGHALGLGATIALCCDITVMAEGAKIGDTHVKMGLAAGDGGALIWPELIGLVGARRYLLTGDLLTGREAAEIGLITAAAPDEELDEEVERWVEKLGNGASQAISATKRALNMRLRQDAAAYMDAHLGLETMSQLSEDHTEAVKAFIEKRKPNFTGK